MHNANRLNPNAQSGNLAHSEKSKDRKRGEALENPAHETADADLRSTSSQDAADTNLNKSPPDKRHLKRTSSDDYDSLASSGT